MSEFQSESLSLEETNRLRVSLGLKPIEDDAPREARAAEPPAGGAPQSQADQDALSERNYAEHVRAEQAKRDEEAVRERVSKARNRRELARKLQGPTLGDADEQSASSSRSWVKQAAKRAKANAAARARQEEEQDRLEQQEYGEADLRGLRVAHDADAFGDDDRILTLRDADVLGGDEDELVEESLVQQDRDQRNRERKKGARAYTGVDDDEFADDSPMTIGSRPNVLSKYDSVEELDAQDHKQRAAGGFQLGNAPPRAPDYEAKRAEEQRVAEARQKQLTNLDYLKNVQVSDYIPEDVAFKKKPKSHKKRRATRVKVEEDEEPPPPAPPAPAADAGDVEMKPADPAPEPAPPTENFVDDDELAASLARARRQKARQQVAKMTPEAIARNCEWIPVWSDADPTVAAQREAEEAEQRQRAEEQGMVFDDTTEFVENIKQRPIEERARSSSAAAEPAAEPAAAEVDAGALLDRPTDAGTEPPAEPQEAPSAALQDAAPTPPADAAAAPEEPPLEVETPVATGGLASALNLVRRQGLLEETTPELREREQRQRAYDAWIETQKREEAERERELLQSKAQGGQKDQATRERENRLREKRDAEWAQERFKDYKPDVSIDYHDEFGRKLSQKEAWKQLSHVFHGKAPGHKAQEKRLRRIEEERRRERAMAGDAADMTTAFQERSARTGQAHMVLSVGNRGNAPQELDMLETDVARPPEPAPKPAPNPAPEPQDEALGLQPTSLKRRPARPPRPVRPTDAEPVVPVAPAPAPAPTEPAPPANAGMKPAFAPIGGARPPGGAAPGAAPGEAPRERIRISLGKRKSQA